MELITLYSESLQIIKEIKNVRKLQKEYFKTRSLQVLQASKSAEQRLDKKLKYFETLQQIEKNHGVIQNNLFDCEDDYTDSDYFKATTLLYKGILLAQEHCENTEMTKELGRAYSYICDLVPVERKL